MAGGIVAAGANMAELQEILDTRFNQAFGAAQNSDAVQMTSALAMTVPCPGDDLIVPFYGGVTSVEEFKDTVVSSTLDDKQITVTPKIWNNSVAISDKLMRDKTGVLLQNRITDLAVKVANKLPERVGKLIQNGDATTYGSEFLGNNFFANDHTWGSSGVNDNFFTITGTTQADILTDIGIGINALKTMKDDKGDTINVGLQNNLIIVAPWELFFIILSVVNPAVEGGGETSATNYVRNLGIKVFGCTEITDDDEWYMFLTGGTSAPFVIAENQGVVTEIERRASKLESLYIASACSEVAYGDFRRAVKFD